MTGKKRTKIKRVCQCGCNQKFTTTFPRQIYKNDTHAQRVYDAKRRVRIVSKDK